MGRCSLRTVTAAAVPPLIQRCNTATQKRSRRRGRQAIEGNREASSSRTHGGECSPTFWLDGAWTAGEEAAAQSGREAEAASEADHAGAASVAGVGSGRCDAESAAHTGGPGPSWRLSLTEPVSEACPACSRTTCTSVGARRRSLPFSILHPPPVLHRLVLLPPAFNLSLSLWRLLDVCSLAGAR